MRAAPTVIGTRGVHAARENTSERAREKERKQHKTLLFRSSDSHIAPKQNFVPPTALSFCIRINSEKLHTHPWSSRAKRSDITWHTCVLERCKFEFQLVAGCASSNPKSTQATRHAFLSPRTHYSDGIYKRTMISARKDARRKRDEIGETRAKSERRAKLHRAERKSKVTRGSTWSYRYRGKSRRRDFPEASRS